MIPITVNAQVVIESENCSALIRRVAKRVNHTTYLSVPTFFESLSNKDLGTLSEYVEIVRATAEDESSNFSVDEKERAHRELILLTLMLANAEGAASLITNDQLERCTKLTMLFTSLESIHRKGLIDIDRSQMTYFDEATGPIAKWRDYSDEE